MQVRVAFLYNAQSHHVLHSLPVACELSRIPDMLVTILARTRESFDLARRLSLLYPGSRLTFERLRPSPGLRWLKGSKWAKRKALFHNRHHLNDFDALVLPERTSLMLKYFGVRKPRYIHTFHGSSGHDRTEDRRIRKFDLLLAPSSRRIERIAAANGEQRPSSTVIGYSKLDLVGRLGTARLRPFTNDRPIVLYNPHHWPHKSSWQVIGREVLEYFAARPDYNLIFAPHVRLFDPPSRHEAQFREFAGLANILIDLGSEHSIDMSYTLAADVYLGDVSSQIFEFVLRPRPCIFLNPRHLPWQGDEDFASWRLGRVVSDIAGLDAALATREQWQTQYELLQRQSSAENFPDPGMPPPVCGARAIASFLRRDGEGNATDFSSRNVKPRT